MNTVTIAGAGPAGLAAALSAVRAGARARVLERRAAVGARFHGDFQGIENWSTRGDALRELADLGVSPTFECTPFHECVVFDPEGREYRCESDQPLWYQVRRGREPGTLDHALERQARAAGVEIELRNSVSGLSDGGVVAHGPRRADAIAVGYVFETDAPDSAFVALSDDLAASGYAYQLVCRGRGTVAACLFADFHNEQTYLERTTRFFKERTGVSIDRSRRFGGFGNMTIDGVLHRGRLSFAGEAAGLQDPLFGFGIRYALVSGALAGRAHARRAPEQYAGECRRRLVRLVRTGFVNRALFVRAGARGYRRLAAQAAAARDPRAWLHRLYTPRWWTPLLLPLAFRDAEKREQRASTVACLGECECTWCQCHRTARISDQPLNAESLA